MMAGAYDRIARFYDVDMARNMPFDDVGFYRDVCRRHPGRVLEMGCGTGRILLPLLDAGIDAIGIDASDGMLRELTLRARRRGRGAPVCRMDMRALGFRRGFAVALLPYSLVTYLAGENDPERALAEVSRALLPGGRLVVDAFIPRPVATQAEFTLDYRRPFGEGVLARWKRITPLSASRNRIERRYEVRDGADRVQEAFEVAEEIRPFAPDDLRALLASQGFAVEETWWDYARRERGEGAQFCTLVASSG